MPAQSILLDANCKITEESTHDKGSEDDFVSLTVTEGAYAINLEKFQAAPNVDAPALQSALRKSSPIKDLRFVPYYFRANREGKGQMRVGLKALNPPPVGESGLSP